MAMLRNTVRYGTLVMLPILAILVRNAIIHPWDPELILDPFIRDTSLCSGSQPLDTPEYTRRNVRIPFGPAGAIVSGDAYLYMPKGVTRPVPLVVMAGGLGQQRDMGLHRYADRFAVRGMAALAFDYRSFGGSDGEPRNLVDPQAHVADFVSVVRWAQQTSLNGSIDPKRIAIWGTSLGGGHVIVAAAQLGDAVKAVVSLVPHLSGSAAAMTNIRTRGLLGALRLVAAGLVDRLRDLSGLPAAYIKLAGPPGSLSVMQMDADEMKTYRSKHPKDPMGGWQMRITARTTLLMGRYNPIKSIAGVGVPTLITTADHDLLCPPSLAAQAAARNPLVTHRTVNCSHFEIYTILEVREEQADFLEQHLKPERPTPAEDSS